MDRLKYTFVLTATTALLGLAVSVPTASAAGGWLETGCPPGGCHDRGCAPCGPHQKHYCCCCSYCCQGVPGCCDGHYMSAIERAQWYNWNRNYSYTDFGQPTVLVVPPTANLQTNWGWGVASSRISRIDHQFQRNYPGGGQFGGPFRPTPIWPSDTTEFGVFPVRGPW